MSSIFQSQKLTDDFASFKGEILKLHDSIVADETAVALPEFKKYHSLVYAIALIQIKVSEFEKATHRSIFLREIQSDLLLLLTHSIFGFYNTSMMTYRRVIENFYNHVFYYNHEVEFIHLNNGRNEYTPIIELKQYLATHPKFSEGDELIKNYNDFIFNEYTELNKFVHAKGVNFMGLSKSLNHLKQKIEYKETLARINESVYRMIYILYKFHKEIKMKQIELKLITDCIPKNKRTALTG